MSRPVLRLPLLLLVLSLVPGPGPAGAADRLRVGDIPSGSSLPLECARDAGTLAAEGIDVEVVPFRGGPGVVEAMAGGSLDIGMVATVSVFQAVERGLDLVMLAPAGFVGRDRTPGAAIMALKDSGITQPGQLRGKTIGVNAIRGINYLWIAEYLSRGGVRPEQVTLQELSFPNMAQALEARRVDAAFIGEPFAATLRDSGKIVVLALIQELTPGASLAGYVSLRSWYQRNQVLAERFHRALARGIEICVKDEGRARRVLATYTKIAPEIAARIGLIHQAPSFTLNDLAALQDLARRHRLLDRGVDLSAVVIPAALAR